MKYIVLTLFVLCGCDPQENMNDKADRELSEMESPVILIGKEKTMAGFNVSLIDANGQVKSFGDLQTLGGTLGESRNIGDTIK